jgi:hypothetical protein
LNRLLVTPHITNKLSPLLQGPSPRAFNPGAQPLSVHGRYDGRIRSLASYYYTAREQRTATRFAGIVLLYGSLATYYYTVRWYYTATRYPSVHGRHDDRRGKVSLRRPEIFFFLRPPTYRYDTTHPLRHKGERKGGL